MLQRGAVFDRLTVIGYGGTRSDGATYVVRCRCGLYGYRSAKSLRNPKSHKMCDNCCYLEDMKGGTHMAPADRAAARALKAEQKAAAQGRPATIADALRAKGMLT